MKLEHLDLTQKFHSLDQVNEEKETLIVIV